jgi:hypothetical protein
MQRQPRGEANDITTHDEPIVYDRSASDAPPPLTFAEAEQHNPFASLIELHDHAMALDVEGKRPDNPRHHLAELALSAAVVAWWSRWQPISIHRAFVAGASLADVAAAIGSTEADAYDRWSRWADTQTKLIVAGHPSVEPSAVTAIRVRLAGEAHAP